MKKQSYLRLLIVIVIVTSAFQFRTETESVSRCTAVSTEPTVAAIERVPVANLADDSFWKINDEF